MNFQKANNITGWLVALVACSVYILTMEPTGSLWDCGEFVSSAYKLGIPHPPGAPLFILLGRIFTLFTPQDAAIGVNLLSALASGFTILFLFWTITHFGRRLVQKNQEELSGAAIFNIMSAGVIGALAYTFSDSFWFSAVEGEVYALSSFFTAIVFWAMLRWEHEDSKAGLDDVKRTKAERWIILIFFMIGLSIGVHLLNLLTIPAIVMIYYFRRYTPTLKGGIYAFLIGCVITGVVQVAVIQWSIGLAGWFDRQFVNSFSLPFFSGFSFFFILLAVLIAFSLRMAHQRHLRFVRLGLWSFVFMLIGYSPYITTMIRANADPAVDMNDVNNPIALVSYLNREQYGDIPLLKGQMFTAEPEEYEEVGPSFQRVGDRYLETGKKVKPRYDRNKTMYFPRVWDASNDQGHADYYAQFLGIEKVQDPSTGEVGYDRDPKMIDNIKFFFGYQLNIMYWRYFMWNFAGKQNDLQGLGENRNGNWISGISFLDNIRLGKQELMPESLKKNKAHNKLYFLPVILGALGFAFQYYKHRKDWFVALLLFFFTGLAIVLYLNQAGPQPRERDYAYVGSFYAFAIWIGLGYFQVKEWIEKVLKGQAAAYISALLCFAAVPLLMAFEEWDDHDRSQKTIAPDLASNYLESCAPNAILFTVGDNDTYPLWYAQEVKGIRPDVRVINTSLLGTDWYINQLRYKINESDPIDVIWNEEQIQGDKRNIIYVDPMGEGDSLRYDLYDQMKNQAGSDNNSNMIPTQRGDFLNYIKSSHVKIPVDKQTVLQNGTVTVKDSVLSELNIDIPKSYLFKNDAAMLNIIAASKWKRPIYFTQPQQLGFDEYLRQDGLSFRLVPVAGVKGTVNTDWMLDKVLKKFRYGGATQPKVYYDEENRRHMVSIRNAHTILAMNLLSEGRKEDARKVLRRCDEQMPSRSVPYAMPSRYGNDNAEKGYFFGMVAMQADDKELGKKVLLEVKKDLQQQIAYYNSLSEGMMGVGQEYEFSTAQKLLTQVEAALKQ
jgi:hypothetical protein